MTSSVWSVASQHMEGTKQTMALKLTRVLLISLIFFLPIWGNVLRLQKRDWVGSPSSSVTEGDVECFSEYMELWIHRMRIEGLRLWLSGILRIQVGMVSMENLNHQLSSCGFALHRDLEKNYIFRVMYSGCFVQLEHDNYVIVLNLLKRVSRFGGRTQKFLMKCPAVLAPPNREYIQCDSDFIQVTREIPVDNWNNELDWSLALSGSLVVALEDSSLIQVNVEMHKPNITVQGRRDTILSPVQVFKSEGHFLPLKLVSGHYAYSMEGTCPNVNQTSSEDTVLYVYKRRMGLTRRGGYQNETLSVGSVIVEQTDTFTWSETSDFVQLIIPTSHIQLKKECIGQAGEKLQQHFYKVDAVLTFKETNHKMHWTMENTSPCSEMLESHLHLMRDDPQEANVTTHSPEGFTGKPEVPDGSHKEFTPPVSPETISTASQTADEKTSITSLHFTA
ncbi:uncharacterized protein C1orf127 homolog isoform X2 [Puntigrus tetrazona]|uniref:uncharacterized protein C1orf127 homolog isoform X2 n=1 Tax=Puntigrus tetrazona TaxID=1606681 RepID=UPI001C8ABBD5|nr:uncharacterized protein C1orf127 homolog isoform X2 [Puntigrus tetrazona]XP_043080541.1 uncharacterized protein C1orf127 homolog isoform X2 [Puntigrus tetrazona]